MWVTARNSSQAHGFDYNIFYLNLFCFEDHFFSQCISPFWPGQGSATKSASPETEELWGG